MVTVQNGSEVIDQILKGTTPPVRDVLKKFQSWTPQEQVFNCRRAIHEGMAPALRGEGPAWDEQAVDQALALLDACLNQYEQFASRQRSGSSS